MPKMIIFHLPGIRWELQTFYRSHTLQEHLIKFILWFRNFSGVLRNIYDNFLDNFLFCSGADPLPEEEAFKSVMPEYVFFP